MNKAINKINVPKHFDKEASSILAKTVDQNAFQLAHRKNKCTVKPVLSTATNPAPSLPIPIGLNFLFLNFES